MASLFAHQQRLAVAAAAATPDAPLRKVLAWETGAGKSLGGMAAASTKMSALYVVPKGLKAKWQRDIDARGGVSQFSSQRPLLLTKEEFKKAAGALPRYDAVIVDEAHAFASPTSQLHRALQAYLERARPSVTLLMTATPFRSSPWNVYAYLRLLGHRVSYVQFRARFFSRVRMQGREVWLPRRSAEAELAALLGSVCDVARLSDLQDVPAQVVETVSVPRSPALDGAVAAAQAGAWTPLEMNLREHQACGDPAASGKLPHLLAALRDAEKGIVVCRYRAEMAALAEILAEHYGDRVHQIHGDVADRDGELARFRAPGRSVLLANASTCEGWEAPECGLVVFWSLGWGNVEYAQALGRVQRANAIKRNAYVHLVVEGSVDEDVLACVTRKQDFQGMVYRNNRRT